MAGFGIIVQIMPAIDQCEPQVIRALQKAGWIVLQQPFAIRIDQSKKAYVYADLRLQNWQNRQSIIITEVKCFAENRPTLDEFYHAVGQYITYRNALNMNSIRSLLYLAVPLVIYSTFFQKPLVQAVIHDAQIKLIVVNLEKEEIVRWIN